MGQELPFPKSGVDYSLTIHVTGIRERSDCGGGYCSAYYEVDVLVSGRKLELMCPSEIPETSSDWMPLALGDLHGRVVPKASGVALGDGYEIVTPKGRLLGCRVSGIFE
jgi:hypothetical protein